jgi:hypothetical protein
MGTDVVGSGLPWVDAIAASFAPYSFAEFHRVELPRLAGERAGSVAADLRGVAPPAFRIEDGTTFTWHSVDGRVRVVAGDDDRDEMRHFLTVAGYLRVKAVFGTEETVRYASEVEHVRSLTTPGDPFSWWSVNADGDEVVTRIDYLGRHSQPIDELCPDPRLLHYATLASDAMRVCDDRLDGPMVFVKNSNVVKGNGDLGRHVDDGIGGHPVMCPLIQAGVQLDHATPENGQVLVLAGSHRSTKHWYEWGAETGLPVVAIETEPGDLTLHYGDTMHTTPPPTADGAGRRASYCKFSEPHTFA